MEARGHVGTGSPLPLPGVYFDAGNPPRPRVDLGSRPSGSHGNSANRPAGGARPNPVIRATEPLGVVPDPGVRSTVYSAAAPRGSYRADLFSRPACAAQGLG